MMKLLDVKNREEWRAWLNTNQDSPEEIWLVYHKDGRAAGVDYESSVEEALCFGWVDSLIKKIDETQYARKFTPRKAESKWSPSNIARVEKMLREGRMSARGLALVESAKRSGAWDNPTSRPLLDFTVPANFEAALQASPAARATFEGLRQTERKQYLTWIITAKRPETQERRINESIRLLEQGQKLGLR
jgi:uncharacterized protein YdeI (YjbR/CyaY-like superfamily)